jgi:hypothetical protein
VAQFLRHYCGDFSVLLGGWRATVIFAPKGDMAAAFSPIMIVSAWVQAFNAAGTIEALANTPPPEANVSLLSQKSRCRHRCRAVNRYLSRAASSYDSSVEGNGFGTRKISYAASRRTFVASVTVLVPEWIHSFATRNRWFESIPLQQTVRLSREVRAAVENPGCSRG